MGAPRGARVGARPPPPLTEIFFSLSICLFLLYGHWWSLNFFPLSFMGAFFIMGGGPGGLFSPYGGLFGLPSLTKFSAAPMTVIESWAPAGGERVSRRPPPLENSNQLFFTIFNDIGAFLLLFPHMGAFLLLFPHMGAFLLRFLIMESFFHYVGAFLLLLTPWWKFFWVAPPPYKIFCGHPWRSVTWLSKSYLILF